MWALNVHSLTLFSLCLNLVSIQEAFCQISQLFLKTFLSNMITMPTKLTDHVNFIISILEHQFLLNGTQFLVILIFFNKTLLPVFVFQQVHSTVLDRYQCAFVIQLSDKLRQTHSLVEINFPNRYLIFLQLNIILNLSLLYIKQLVLPFLLKRTVNCFLLKITRFDYLLWYYL